MMIIRPATSKDAEAVRSVAVKSWMDTYGTFYTNEEIEEFMETVYSYDNLLKSISESESSRNHHFLVSEEGGSITGIMEVIKREAGWEILRLYVLPEYQRQKIGTELLAAVMETVKKGPLRVCVEVRNKRGLSFYRNAGFDETKRQKDDFFVLTGELLVLEKALDGIAS